MCVCVCGGGEVITCILSTDHTMDICPMCYRRSHRLKGRDDNNNNDDDDDDFTDMICGPVALHYQVGMKGHRMAFELNLDQNIW